MNAIKRLLFRLLGLKIYLKTIRNIFFLSYNNGWLKNNPEYYCHYYVKNLIKKGATVIDIGANLGYYSRIFAGLTGASGHVYSVEPVAVFREILTGTIKKHKHVQVLPYALGKEDGEKIAMGLPYTNKYLSHGRTKVMDLKPDDKYAYKFTAEMKHPVNLFNGIEKIDYIKCDIEGYEKVVIPEMMPLIEKHLPIMQIETEGETREEIFKLLSPLGYTANWVSSDGLRKLASDQNQDVVGDIIFIPAK